MRPGLMLLLLFVVLAPLSAFADGKGRAPSPERGDPCGLPDTTTAAYRLAASMNWGYGFDSLRADLLRWDSSPFVRIDSIGATVQNRPIFMLTIEDTAAAAHPRERVWIHARTHPNEVQGTWVTNHIIARLLGPTTLGQHLRRSCIFNIVPMINPDGVELAKPRENAHNVDIESNWAKVPGEPEVQTLRRTFGTLMATAQPIRIALNMHSAYGEQRYFVYHDTGGTSVAFSVIQQRFINGVRTAFPGGIEPWWYFVSWKNAPATVYPESWFWQNHREVVLALTYEDMNSTKARAFDSTAAAILSGIADELAGGSPTSAPLAGDLPSHTELAQNYPNPFNPVTRIRLTLHDQQPASVRVYDLLGREIARLMEGMQEAGIHSLVWDARGMASGTYICRVVTGGQAQAIRMTLIR